MNESEHDLFENELRELRPAKLPEDFVERLTAARMDCIKPDCKPSPQISLISHVLQWFRWLAPATTIAGAVVALALWTHRPAPEESALNNAPADIPVLRADKVEIDRQLVGSFETIATLADGEPVRVRCREWMDAVVLRDTSRGVAIQGRTPRLEVIPVSFETF